jgi:proteasome lid subunit RPN8/RPN11
MVKIPQKIINQIIEQAKQEAPLEACGYLAGKDNQIIEIFPMTNLDKSPEHFSFDPKEQFKVVKAARQKGLELIAVYHSHPASPARLSKEDVRLAYDAEMVHLIHSLQNQETHAYRVIKGESKKEEIEIIE